MNGGACQKAQRTQLWCIDSLCFTCCFLLFVAKLAFSLSPLPTEPMRPAEPQPSRRDQPSPNRLLLPQLFRLFFCFSSFLTFSRCTIIEFAEQEAPPFFLCNCLLRGLLRIYAISNLELRKAYEAFRPVVCEGSARCRGGEGI